MATEPVPSAADAVSASDLIAVLRDKAPRLAAALAAGQMAWPAARALRRRARDQATYTVKIPGTDGFYDDLHDWVLGLLPSREQRALVAYTPRQGTAILPADGRERAVQPPVLRLRYDGAREQAITVAGHTIRTVVFDSQAPAEGRAWRPPEIMFTASSAAGRDALLAEISQVLRHVTQRQRTPSFRMLDKWGDWERLDDLPARDLDSVILPPGQIERLAGDITRFLASEQEYARRCIPWHRCHLYEGPPGTGKTSVAQALAAHFGMDVWYLPLADVQKDGALLRTVGRVSARSMLLLEDIDVFHAVTQRDDDSGVTLSGLLNTLDGIATPHGLFTVLTTNRPEVLDEAICRAGRVDLTEHFSLAGPGEIQRLIGRWYRQEVTVPRGAWRIAPSEVIGACQRHDTPDEVIAELFLPAAPADARF